ncbi:hypothetical protein TVAG_280970 [Trichomonas vaginalis G3]|uniref:Uncharacterized protein n=1 Tax=Trichomonas vaginalis (strain ATCC PRA-98 / G3) TaxID=412133 RepID=A2DRL7_TRIV3|nr:glycoprotein 38 family [Trichomonas vaginalis G3]EAY16980.1 hypothetical protein TVAG_280970 [Trichomonas vaginalis G3]KAI5508973.1 glycoprotein 38 family [Trichomonas vaginalis G3]|eukprot:XP_001329203.1 hypothetical protein [Trichomonas vaginalis G3]
MGDKNYTLLKKNVAAFDFTEDGKLYCTGNEEITAIIFDLSEFKADDYLYITGNANLTIGTTSDSQYKLDPTKSLVLVATTFDGNGEFSSFSYSDYNPYKLSIKYYNIDGDTVYSRKSLSFYRNFRIITFKCEDSTYEFNRNFQTQSSSDKETMIINSKVGTHKFASEPDNSNPAPNPNPGKTDPKPGSNPTETTNGKEDGSDAKTGGGNGGKIAGAVIGVLIVIAIVCVVVFFVLKKKKASEEKDSNDDQVHEDASMDDAVGV